jgi:hypothetical protein
MRIFPQCFENVPGALQANIQHFKERFPLLILLTLIVIPTFSVIVAQFDHALVQYMEKLVSDQKMSQDDASRTIAISKFGIYVLLVPWLLMASYFPTIKKDLTVRNLIPKLLENLTYMSHGWFYGFIKFSYTLFGIVLLVCVCGLIIDESKNFYVSVATCIIFASILVFSLTRIYLLLVFPYIASSLQTRRLKQYKVKASDGLATYLLFVVAITVVGISTLFRVNIPEFPFKHEATLGLAALLFQISTAHLCEMISRSCTIEARSSEDLTSN